MIQHPEAGSEMRVLRGGSWYYSVGVAAASFRYRNNPDDRDFDFGFRVVAVSASPFRSSDL